MLAILSLSPSSPGGCGEEGPEGPSDADFDPDEDPDFLWAAPAKHEVDSGLRCLLIREEDACGRRGRG